MWTVDAAKTLHLRGAILPPIAVLPVVKTPLALGRGLYESEFHLFKDRRRWPGPRTLSNGLSVSKKSGLSRPDAPIDGGGGRGSTGFISRGGPMYPARLRGLGAIRGLTFVQEQSPISCLNFPVLRSCVVSWDFCASYAARTPASSRLTAPPKPSPTIGLRKVRPII
jgi:hypothetical protein